MLFESALSYIIDIFKDETVKAVTEESNLFYFIGPRHIWLPSNYGKGGFPVLARSSSQLAASACMSTFIQSQC
jgi:hypothetical protein